MIIVSVFISLPLQNHISFCPLVISLHGTKNIILLPTQLWDSFWLLFKSLQWNIPHVTLQGLVSTNCSFPSYDSEKLVPKNTVILISNSVSVRLAWQSYSKPIYSNFYIDLFSQYKIYNVVWFLLLSSSC